MAQERLLNQPPDLPRNVLVPPPFHDLTDPGMEVSCLEKDPIGFDVVAE
jgi:hypothetical protein